MLNFVLRGKQTETAGGILWTWQRLWSGNLFDTEGIWLPTRLLVFQATQVAAGIVIIYMVFFVTQWAAKEARTFQAELDPTLPDWAKE
jgi:ascorbate-specific PTS system EIIC-type component UlaA